MAFVPVTLRVWFAVVLIVVLLVPPPPDHYQPVGARTRPTGLADPAAILVQAVRISQVYGGGGGTGSGYPCDYVELFNARPDPVSLAGWSVQYAAANSSSWWFTDLSSLTIKGYGYLQILFSCGSASPPPGYDLKTGVAMNPTDGKVALAIKGSKITGAADPSIVDFVGYGTANEYEGSQAAPALNASKAGRRGGEGCTDSDDNRADFVAGEVSPHNGQSPSHPCAEGAPVVWSTTPKSGATNVARDALLTVDFSERVNLDADWFELRCNLGGVQGPATATVTGGPYKFTIDPAANLLPDDACRFTVNAPAVHDADDSDPPDTMTADYVANFSTVAGQCGDAAYAIDALQGAGTSSPAAGQVRTIEGVVSADFQDESQLSGYFVQEDPAEADANPETSGGIFVDESGGTLGDVTAGDRVRLTGSVARGGRHDCADRDEAAPVPQPGAACAGRSDAAARRGGRLGTVRGDAGPPYRCADGQRQRTTGRRWAAHPGARARAAALHAAECAGRAGVCRLGGRTRAGDRRP